MNKKKFVVHENYDWINIGNNPEEISYEEFLLLKIYIENYFSNKKILEISFNKFRFYNIVGVLEINNIRIEILPKLSLENKIDEDRKILLNILSKCYNLPLYFLTSIKSSFDDNNFLELLGNIYLKNLQKELSKGIYKEYTSSEVNSKFLKGRLLLKDHLKKNFLRNNLIYSKEEYLTEFNSLNILLKKTLIILLKKIDKFYLRKEILKTLEYFKNIPIESIENVEIENIIFNNKNSRFKKILEFSNLIISGSNFNFASGIYDSFGILFDMPKLFEKYIFILLKELSFEYDLEINYQEKIKKLLINKNSNKAILTLTPDIVLYEDSKAKLIIDTKWKNNYTSNDIYQIHTYLTSYEDVKKGILIYPQSLSKSENIFLETSSLNNKKEIEIIYLNIFDTNLTKSILRNLLINI